MTATKRRTKPLTVTIEQPARLRHSAVVRGPVRVVHPAIKAAGVPWQYSHQRHGYLIPRQRVDDVAARLELDGHRVEIPMPGWS